MKNNEKSQARQSALKTLYEREFSPAQAQTDKKNKTNTYIDHLLQGVHTHKKRIDNLIKQSSHFWKMDRMSLIDLNIMRIAVYEMLYSQPPVPFKVCIDEALKMAKIYGAADSSKFINGNLDAIFKNTLSPSVEANPHQEDSRLCGTEKRRSHPHTGNNKPHGSNKSIHNDKPPRSKGKSIKKSLFTPSGFKPLRSKGKSP